MVSTVATFLIAPRLIAKAFTSPKFVNALLRWDKTPVGTARYTRASAQLLGLMDEVRTEVEREEKLAGLLAKNEGRIPPECGLPALGKFQMKKSPAQIVLCCGIQAQVWSSVSPRAWRSPISSPPTEQFNRLR